MIKYFSPSIPTCYLSTKKIRKQRAIKINLESERIQISRIWNKKYVDDGVGVDNVSNIIVCEMHKHNGISVEEFSIWLSMCNKKNPCDTRW